MRLCSRPEGERGRIKHGCDYERRICYISLALATLSQRENRCSDGLRADKLSLSYLSVA